MQDRYDRKIIICSYSANTEDVHLNENSKLLFGDKKIKFPTTVASSLSNEKIY